MIPNGYRMHSPRRHSAMVSAFCTRSVSFFEPKEVANRIVDEIDKDLTDRPIDEIEAVLTRMEA